MTDNVVDLPPRDATDPDTLDVAFRLTVSLTANRWQYTAHVDGRKVVSGANFPTRSDAARAGVDALRTWLLAVRFNRDE